MQKLLSSHFPTLKRYNSQFLSVMVLALLATGVILTVNQTKQQSSVSTRAQMAGMPMGANSTDTCEFLNPGGVNGVGVVDTTKTAAFCDDFAEGPRPNSGSGRGGALDEKRWVFSRLIERDFSPSQGQNNHWPPTKIQRCRDTIPGVLPPNDSFMCGPEFGESMHWMEAFNDAGTIVYDGAMIRQPFDFAATPGRPFGTITFDVDGKSCCNHGWHPEVWIVDEPFPIPYQEQNVPRNGVGFIWASDGGSVLNQSGTTYVNSIQVFGNYRIIDQQVGGNTYTWQQDNFNHFEIRMSTSHIELWGSDIDRKNFRLLNQINTTVTLTTGFVSFMHAQYNAGKDDGLTSEEGGSMTYHWDNMGFDGPHLPTPRTYVIPDSFDATANCAGVPGCKNLGYYVDGNSAYINVVGANGEVKQPKTFTMNGVNLSGASQALLNFMAFAVNQASDLQYQFNGGQWRSFTLPVNFVYTQNIAVSIPVPLSDLKNGTNTLNFRKTTSGSDPLGILNIDLQIDPGDQLSVRVADDGIGSMTPTPTLTPTRTPTPTLTPTNTPSPLPTSTPTPSCPRKNVGDADCNGIIDIIDLSILESNYGSTTDLRADFSGNGVVDIFDLSILESNFGT